MSSLDRVDLAVLTGCCVRAAHARPGIGAEGTTTTCPCGTMLVIRAGRWTREENTKWQTA